MSNLAIGIALGSSMANAGRYGSGGSIDIPAWLAVILLITLLMYIIATVIHLYISDQELLKSHWEKLIIGPVIGLTLWAISAFVVGTIIWLISYIV